MTRPKQDRIPILERTDARGRLLYRRTGGGNIARNYKVRQAVKEAIKERDGFRCVLCGHAPEALYELEVDHIVPYLEGGRTRRTTSDRCAARVTFIAGERGDVTCGSRWTTNSTRT